MKHPITLLTLAVALAGAAVAAQAHDMDAAPKTRAQVRQELADAIRDGTLPFGETGMTMREMFPSRYPKRPAAMAAPMATPMAASAPAAMSMAAPDAGAGRMH